MKRCPTCNKTFSDQNLSYCIDDGTPLLDIPEDDELTEVQPNSPATYAPPAYQPPSYAAPVAGKKRRVWPWLVGIGALLLLTLVGFVVAAVMLIPRLKESQRSVVNPSSNSRENDGSSANANSQANENSAASNTNTTLGSSTPAPTDKELVLSQLKDLEHEWTVANINADKKKLGEILADDYVGPDGRGRMQGKAEYLKSVERDTSIESWEFDDLKLTLRGDRATLIGKVKFKAGEREALYDFVDRFVWRDNRWQATGSEVTQNE